MHILFNVFHSVQLLWNQGFRNPTQNWYCAYLGGLFLGFSLHPLLFSSKSLPKSCWHGPVETNCQML